MGKRKADFQDQGHPTKRARMEDMEYLRWLSLKKYQQGSKLPPLKPGRNKRERPLAPIVMLRNTIFKLDNLIDQQKKEEERQLRLDYNLQVYDQLEELANPMDFANIWLNSNL